MIFVRVIVLFACRDRDFRHTLPGLDKTPQHVEGEGSHG